MDRKAVVFFSHSSDDNERAEQLCQAIEASGSVRTTIDLRDLRQAQPWERQLYRWMARCDAGFLLLTAAVMQRPGWVLQEATLLRARKVFGGDHFPLFVLVDAQARTQTNWKALFEPLGLRTIEGTAETLTPQQIAAAVEKECGAATALEADDFYSRLRDQLGYALEPFAANLPFAKALLAKLAVADEYWRRIVGDDDVLAGTLAQRVCEAHERGAIGAYGGLDAVLQAFVGKGNAEERSNLLYALRPYWVNLGAALKLAATMRRPPGERLCALLTSRPADTPALYIDRFFGPYNRLPTVLQLTAGNEFAVDMTAQVVDAWNDKFPALKVAGVAELCKRLQKLSESVPVVVVLPPLVVPGPARAVAAAIPDATFVVPVTHGSADLAGADWGGIETLEPGADADSEDTYFQHYEFARQYAAQR